MVKSCEKLGEEAFLLGFKHDFRRSADMYLKAFHSASTWHPMRVHYLKQYAALFDNKNVIPAPSDLEAMERLADDKSEPKVFRAEAALILAEVTFDRRDVKEAADGYRRTARLVGRADGEERARTVLKFDKEKAMSVIGRNFRGKRPHLASAARINKSFMTEMSVSSVLDDLRDHAELRLRSLECKSRAGDAPTTSPSVLIAVPPGVDEGRLKPGGNACDCCGKTLEELGKKTLGSCQRCGRAYYCGAECQKKSWKSGHKAACRKPGQIEVGDYMQLVGLQKLPEMNEQIVRVVGPAPREGRWVVKAETENKYTGEILVTGPVSIAAKNLVHIRPEY